MSQNTLIEKIKADAAKAVEKIKAAGATEIESIRSGVEADIADLQAAHEAQLAKKKSQLELVAVSKAKQAGKIAVQSKKREHIDAILASVTKELIAQDADAYVKFFTPLVTEAVEKGVEVKTVHAPKNRADETTTMLKAADISAAVETNDSIAAGVVIHAVDGVYDVTLERLMNDKRAELEMIIVNKVGA